MAAITLTSIAGREGSIRIPALGTIIGRLVNWSLKRRGEDDGANERLFDLRAVLSYVNPALFNHPEYSEKRVIRVKLGKNEYIVEGGTNVVLDGNVLTMEGVTLCRV